MIYLFDPCACVFVPFACFQNVELPVDVVEFYLIFAQFLLSKLVTVLGHTSELEL